MQFCVVIGCYVISQLWIARMIAFDYLLIIKTVVKSAVLFHTYVIGLC